MDASPFATILGELVGRVPGAYAAALVDHEGETVDYAGIVDPFEIRVAAAHLRILLVQCQRVGFWGEATSITLKSEKRSMILRALPDGYAITLLLRKRAGFVPCTRAFQVCERALAREANWTIAADAHAWEPARVECDARGRPVTVHDREHHLRVEVLGAVVGLAACEHGFRVRTEAGHEITLVREPGWNWYADAVPSGT